MRNKYKENLFIKKFIEAVLGYLLGIKTEKFFKQNL
jgi:hypothetical protein